MFYITVVLFHFSLISFPLETFSVLFLVYVHSAELNRKLVCQYVYQCKLFIVLYCIVLNNAQCKYICVK